MHWDVRHVEPLPGYRLLVELADGRRMVEVAVGDRVVTAGVDGVYPRGLAVGVVSAVEPGNEMFHRVEVEPAVDLANLSLVYLLESATPPAALTRGAGDAPR